MSHDAWGSVTFTYALMEQGGVYQWRWQEPYPPEANGNPEYSPLFPTKRAAMEWRTTNCGSIPNRTNSEWRKVIEP